MPDNTEPDFTPLYRCPDEPIVVDIWTELFGHLWGSRPHPSTDAE